jgi:lysozyme
MQGKYDEAADAMLASRWAQQTPDRAKRLSDQMRDGAWRFAPNT